MVDSREKYDIIIKRSKPEFGPNGKPYDKFEDTQFKHADESIGDSINNRLSNKVKWVRLSDFPDKDY